MSALQLPAEDETHACVVSTALLAPYAAALCSLAGSELPARGRVDRELGRGFLRVLLGAYLGLEAAEAKIERR